MFFKQHRMYREESGDDGDKGGSGPTVEQLASQLKELADSNETLKADNDRLTAKVSEANKHTKAAEDAAKVAAKAQAEKDGNFEQLYNSSEESRISLQERFDTLQTGNAEKEASAAAMRIAVKLADGENAEILADYIKKRLKSTDQGIKVVDSDGNLTVSTLEDLQKEFSGSARYASLIKGRQSSGGGANGGANGGSSAKETILRADFDALDPAARAEKMKAGAQVVDQI